MRPRNAVSRDPVWRFEAFIEYDDLHLYLGRTGLEKPFSEGTDRMLPLHRFRALREDVHPGFLAVLSGVGPSGERLPLYSPRGLPEHVSPWTEEFVVEAKEGETVVVSWLGLQEIHDRMSSEALTSEDLDLGSQCLLDSMGFLAAELGRDRVRLVFRVALKE